MSLEHKKMSGKRILRPDWSRVDEVLSSAVHSLENKDKFVTPGAVALVGERGRVLYHKAFGSRSIEPEVTPMKESLVFDVASLTKAVVTTTLIMRLVDRGQITIDRRLSHFFQTFGSHGKEKMCVRHLLAHSSGYPDHLPYYKQVEQADRAARAGLMSSREACDFVYNEIFRSRLENLPGKVTKYSDIGYILLGRVAEVAHGGKTIDRLAREEIFKPLGLSSTGYVDLMKLKRGGFEAVSDMIVPTNRCAWRGKLICGEVQDENAWAMGGVAGHAGVFSTAQDIHRFASEMIECYHGRSEYLSSEVLKSFWQKEEGEGTWALGWDTPSKTGSSAGQYFSEQAVGHLGYTGCSLWIEPELELSVVLLTNRVHPSTTNKQIKEFRPLFHDAVMESLGYAS